MAADPGEVISLLLVDDDPVIRAGLRAVLRAADDIKIVGEAADALEAQSMIGELRPKILLLDLKMPGMSAADLERWVRQNYPDVVTLVLTAHDRDAYLAGMIEAGASGYMEKGEPVERLVGAIRRAARGEILFDMDQFARARKWNLNVREKLNSLTQRERQVLKLLGQGMDNKSISSELNISLATVAFHVSRILTKLGVESKQKAVAWIHEYLTDDLLKLLD